MKRFTVRPNIPGGRPVRIGGGNIDDDWVYLGRLAEAGPLTQVRHDLAGEHVVAIVGKRGSGKSYSLGSLIEGLVLKESNSLVASTNSSRAVLLFDTLGIFQWVDVPVTASDKSAEVQKQYGARTGWNLPEAGVDVTVWRPPGDNQPEVHQRELTVKYSDLDASDWAYLLGLDLLQDRMGQLLNDAFHKVTLEGWCAQNVRQQPTQEYSLTALVSCIQQDPELNAAYHSETRRAVVQQLTNYSRNPVFDDSGVGLKDLLKPGHLSVILMNRMTAELRFALITSIVRRLMRSRMLASEIEKELRIRSSIDPHRRESLEILMAESVPPTWIAADEAQNFLPVERRTGASEPLVQLVREGRNYGLSFVITTQQPSAIDPRIMAQVDTLMAHKLTVKTDIDHINRNAKSLLPSQIRFGNQELGLEGLLHELDVGQALVSSTDSPRSLIIDVRPRLSVHGGF